MDRVISMGVMGKKLYVKQTNGIATGCNIYTTAADAGDNALAVRADGAAGYVALKSITDTNATAGRVRIGTMTYAIATQHTAAVTVPYTEQQWTKAGSYTFTIPDGITRVRVAVCGGGAGKGSLRANGGNGGDTMAFGVTATGGKGGGVGYKKGAGGTPNGYNSSGNSLTNGFAVSFTKSYGSYGGGGQYGGSGGYDSQYVGVNTGHTYTLNVGKAGGTNGVGGFILLGYGGDVQNG